MPIVSFAQNFEDVILWRALREVECGFYIDIGAQDPTSDSVSQAFYRNGWRGLHVEPSPLYCGLLRADRPDEQVLQAVVAASAGLLTFFEFPGTGLSTAVAQIAQEHQAAGWDMNAIEVPCVTLDQIFDTVAKPDVHWLKIDVEGFEDQVIAGWISSAVRPWVIVIEAVTPLGTMPTHAKFEQAILEKGYIFAHFDGLNRFYVSEQHDELLRHFQFGPSLWDEFQVPRQSRLAQHLNAEHAVESATLHQSQVEADTRAQMLWGQLDEARNALALLQSDLQGQSAELAQAKGEITKLEKISEQRRAELLAAVAESEVLLKTNAAHVEQLRVQLQHAHDARATASATSGAISARADMLETQLAEARSRGDALVAQVAELSAASARQQAALAASIGHEQRQQLELNRLNGKLAEARSEAVLLEREVAAVRAKAAGFRLVAHERTLALRLSTTALEQARSDYTDIEERMGSAAAAWQEEKTDLCGRLVSLQAELDEASHNLSLTRQDLDYVHRVLGDERQKADRDAAELTQHAVLLDQLRGEYGQAQSAFIAERDLASRLSELIAVTAVRPIWSNWFPALPRSAAMREAVLLAYATGPTAETEVTAGSVDDLLSQPPRVFIPAAYKSLLGRLPDEQGRTHYARQLAEGTPRIGVLRAIHNSAEGRRHTPALPPASLQRLALPWWSRIIRDAPKAARGGRAAASAPANAPWQGARDLLAYQAHDWLDHAYEAVLGRPADAVGRASYADWLNRGVSRLAVLSSLHHSSEGRAFKAALPDLADATRWHRWRKVPLLGAFLQRRAERRWLLPPHTRLDALSSGLDKAEAAVAALGLARMVSGTDPQAMPAASLDDDQAAASGLLAPELVLQPWRLDKLDQCNEFAGALRLIETDPLSASANTVALAAALAGVSAEPDRLGTDAQDVHILWGDGLIHHQLPAQGRSILYCHTFTPSMEDLRSSRFQGIDAIVCRSSHAAKELIDSGIGLPVKAVGGGRVEQSYWRQSELAETDRAVHVIGFRLASRQDAALARFVLDAFAAILIRGASARLAIIVEDEPEWHRAQALISALESHVQKRVSVVIQGQAIAPDSLVILGQMLDDIDVAMAAYASDIAVVASRRCHLSDLCEDTNAIIFEPPLSYANIGDDERDSLADALARAATMEPTRIKQLSQGGRERMRDLSAWDNVARRMSHFVDKMSRVPRPLSWPERADDVALGVLTTWNVQCGIATHSAELLEGIPDEMLRIYAAIQEPHTDDDRANVARLWRTDKRNNRLDEVLRAAENDKIDQLVVQFNYGFYNHPELNSFLIAANKIGIRVTIILHSTEDPPFEQPGWKLAEIVEGLRSCATIVVHGPKDRARLARLGLFDNVLLMPHGVALPKAPALARPIGEVPVLSTFGFCFPNKGLVELVEAVALLAGRGVTVRLKMLNSVHPDPSSAATMRAVVDAVDRHKLSDKVEIFPDFMRIEEVERIIGGTDVFINPYQNTGESASGAVRLGLRMQRPTVVTPLAIFDDLGKAVFRMPGTSPAAMADGIAKALMHLQLDDDVAREVARAQTNWLSAHDFVSQARRLRGIGVSLAKLHQIFTDGGCKRGR